MSFCSLGTARSLRIEKKNGVYHIINRGNYRQDLFINESAHLAFENCLFEACEKCEWALEGFCVMTNHFHLVVRTPKGNLIYGMKWLQSTFANRYHKFRKVHGKLFQGRYKSLIVEEYFPDTQKRRGYRRLNIFAALHPSILNQNNGKIGSFSLPFYPCGFLFSADQKDKNHARKPRRRDRPAH